MINQISNHLWQSTVFEMTAGLLTPAFRKNRTQMRYWLRFSASLKFLILFAAISVPVVFGLLNASQTRAQSQAQNTITAAPAFEVATIKRNESGGGFGIGGGKAMFRIGWGPDTFTATGVSIMTVIQMAYGVQGDQISGGPYWLKSQTYDIEAKMDESIANELRKLSPNQGNSERQRMLQALLADRCKLTIHRESKELPIYALVIAKNGPKLQEAQPGDTYPNGMKGIDGRAHPNAMGVAPGQLTAQAVDMAFLARQLSSMQRELGGRKVFDHTGLTGTYDFTLHWTPEYQIPNGIQGPDTVPEPDSSGPSIFTAIQEQLGLKLESTKGPVDVLVVDHIERPSEN